MDVVPIHNSTGGMVAAVPHQLILRHWEKFGPLVERACARSILAGEDLEGLKLEISEGHYMCAAISEPDQVLGVMLCELVETKDGDSFHVVALAGEKMDLWLDELIDWLRGCAENLRCSKVTLCGRMGWQRKLHQYGFRPLYITMELDV